MVGKYGLILVSSEVTTCPKQDNTIYPNEYHNMCPHLLPCGDCAITMRYCHHGGWNWKPEWTCKSED